MFGVIATANVASCIFIIAEFLLTLGKYN